MFSFLPRVIRKIRAQGCYPIFSYLFKKPRMIVLALSLCGNFYIQYIIYRCTTLHNALLVQYSLLSTERAASHIFPGSFDIQCKLVDNTGKLFYNKHIVPDYDDIFTWYFAMIIFCNIIIIMIINCRQMIITGSRSLCDTSAL